jgi:uncharacterized protein
MRFCTRLLSDLQSMQLHQGGAGVRVVLEGYYDDGFHVFGQRVPGPVAVLPDLALQWRHVASLSDVTIDSLSVFVAAVPKVDILILGTGKRTQLVSPELRSELRRHGIVVEAMASDKALATFNILAEEARNVGAALLTLNETAWKD